MAETPRQREALEGWRRVTPFLTRFIVHEALRDDPVGFKAFVMRTLCLHTGLDHSSPEHAWEAYLDDCLVHEWNPTHVLFEQPPTAVAVNVPVVAPVVTSAPTPTEWLEIAFVDPAGDPVANVGWTVELADGRVMNGITGRNGLFRVGDGPPGTARLTYLPNGLPALKQLAPPGFHTVRQGQDIVSIAWAYGHADWNTVWDDAQNKSARDAHKSPMVLLPGTRLFIPEPDQPTSSYAMSQRHEVVIDPPLSKLEVQLRWAHGDPLADLGYVLRYELGEEQVTVPDLRTDGDGWVRHELPVSVSVVHAVFPEAFLIRTFHLRQLDPVGQEGTPEIAGVQQRLRALGYGCPAHGSVDDTTLDAICSFQHLAMGEDEPSGALSQATLDKLVEECGA
ncbi:MAG: carboxypeptidase regulatory-like domain-containing protein [Myxococcales bacterium]|nr:carboxypeptidase regulatory-like domain-containing protein [Myxococcales bacterium]